MPPISTCVVCKHRFTYVDCPVKCDGCSQRVHRKCSKLSADELKCLGLKNVALKFFCDPCTHGTIQMADIRRLDGVQRSVNISNANGNAAGLDSTSEYELFINRENWLGRNVNVIGRKYSFGKMKPS